MITESGGPGRQDRAPIGFRDSGWYDGCPGETPVARGAILWKERVCALAGPCGLCEEFCPTGVLDLFGDFPGDSGGVCIRCRLCLATCPAGALTMAGPPASRADLRSVL